MSTDPCVRGLLVTGEQPNIMDFWMPLAGVLNTMVRRDRTTHFTLWNDPPVLDAVVESARRAGVSVQEIVGAGDSERYETLHETAGSRAMATESHEQAGRVPDVWCATRRGVSRVGVQRSLSPLSAESSSARRSSEGDQPWHLILRRTATKIA